jgi:capsular exopolysaccharide synthesis family protein
LSIDQLAAVLWRRRLTFVAALAACVAAVVAVTLSLPKTYTATSTLTVGAFTGRETFFDTNLAEQLSRTYSTLASNPNVAESVRKELPLPLTRAQLLRRMSFAPVERTQLLTIRAEGKTPQEAQTIANTYANVFTDHIDEDLKAGKVQVPVAVAEEAVVPTSPSKPNIPLYIGLGTLLSLLGAFGVALLRERLDTRIRLAPEEDVFFGQPILARIPRISLDGGLVPREIRDHFALLKTNLDFSDEKPARALVVTSPGTGEGKSTIAAHLALAYVADGEKVVLVEGDLRRPGLDETILSPSSRRSRRDRARRPELAQVGLTHYLAGAASEEEIIVEHPKFPGLRVVRAGLLPPNPTALLRSHRLETLLEHMRVEYDRIVIDTCPVSVGADASLLASQVDGTVYVLDQRRTNRGQAQAGLNQLAMVHATLLGVVFNSAETPSVEGYYYADRPPEEVELAPPRSEKTRSEAGV